MGGGGILAPSTQKLSAPARQKWCKHGNQASTVLGHNLSISRCPACSPGMPAKIQGPNGQGVTPGL
eukprot:981561-Pelagomonas_calceolata.AAC.3